MLYAVLPTSEDRVSKDIIFFRNFTEKDSGGRRLLVAVTRSGIPLESTKSTISVSPIDIMVFRMVYRVFFS